MGGIAAGKLTFQTFISLHRGASVYDYLCITPEGRTFGAVVMGGELHLHELRVTVHELREHD